MKTLGQIVNQNLPRLIAKCLLSACRMRLNTSGSSLIMYSKLGAPVRSLIVKCACPASIQVHLVNRYAEFGLFEKAKHYSPEACHECGLCSYVCPSQRSLVQLMRLCVEEAAA